ncbi:MAG: 4-hydroxybenzoate polyprenyltransferase [Candidatus Muproteobacteria bacterium RBG_16_65_34]|uniref:4-hydroxybenzoate octaprenyltransferase n=1 Tax=Candidatus Muproteobacteria bacterium RBG_16_65_34 TaxID=1817760 RepID=A0A1F6TTH6_9PROT|nr:MAG: 4-hydroxybenzoate polyprenyltransferase [Candidatus Muproteobacteria bacterium RBG_16_65_34]
MTFALRLREYALLMRLHRPIGILLLLWPTLWALWIAGQGRPDLKVLIVFVLGVVLMRSAGCVINDYADRDFDPHVERTRERPIAAGRVSPREALVLFVILCVAAFGLVLFMNPLTIALSAVAVLLGASYPFTKRYTHLPQLYLGVAFGWSIPMAFAAQTGAVPPLAWVLFAANVLWVIAYDTAYAMVDRDDDLRIGIKSTAILFGTYDRLMVGLSHTAALGLLVLIGAVAGRGMAYYFGLAVAAGLAAYQQRLIRERSREGCFQAFLNNNRFGAAVFTGLLADYL